jgi:chromosome segregation ATPase
MATQIEELRTRKERLKDELQVEEQKERSLQEEIEMLEEKIEIRGIEESLEAKRESVRQLESRKSDLQGKWNLPDQDAKKEEEPKEQSPQLAINVEPTSEPVQAEEQSDHKRRHFF